MFGVIVFHQIQSIYCIQCYGHKHSNKINRYSQINFYCFVRYARHKAKEFYKLIYSSNSNKFSLLRCYIYEYGTKKTWLSTCLSLKDFQKPKSTYMNDLCGEDKIKTEKIGSTDIIFFKKQSSYLRLGLMSLSHVSRVAFQVGRKKKHETCSVKIFSYSQK